MNYNLSVINDSFFSGVDIVLNSLAEEKLQASLRVLAQNGRFLEIGKFDLSNNTALGKCFYALFSYFGAGLFCYFQIKDIFKIL